MILSRRGALGMAGLLGLVGRAPQAAPEPRWSDYLHGETLSTELRMTSSGFDNLPECVTDPATLPSPAASGSLAKSKPDLTFAPWGWDTLENLR